MPIVVAENTALLLERMASDLANGRDPWDRHWLILPGIGRSEWLQRRWARLAGIAAHSQIVPLRSLVEQAAAPSGVPFSRDRLVFAVARALPSIAPRTPLPLHTDCGRVDARVLVWSQQVADALDMGLLCRGESDRFLEAPFLSDLLDSPVVKAALSGHLGMLEPELYRASAKRWIDDWNGRGGVPKLWIQLDSGLPHAILRCLAILLDLLPERLQLFLLSPSLAFWGDLRTRRHWNPGEDAGPVLTGLGRLSQDLHNQSVDLFLSQGSGGCELPSPPLGNPLLARLQAACRSAAAPANPPPLSPDDWSFTAHACRSPLRELEICRDRIMQAMSNDPTLTTEDVIILLADPGTYAPLVGAALSPLPARIVGVGGAMQSPVAKALLGLLRTLNGRLGLADIQALLDEPLVAASFELTDCTAEVLEWLTDSQFRWGLDQNHRAEIQDSKDPRWSLAFALRRLGLGAIVRNDERDGIVDGAAPLERASGLAIAILARLAQFAQALSEARSNWTGEGPEAGRPVAKSMLEWTRLLTIWIERFLDEGQGAIAEQRTQILCSTLPALAAAAPADLLFGSDALLRLLEDALASLGTPQGSNAAGITVADLRQFAGTPARMQLIVGLGAESFPTRDERPSWHPLASRRELGDPDRREGDRHSLLLALLSSQDQLVLTYLGGSDEDSKERPPSTPLADLLTAVNTVSNEQAIAVSQHGVVFRHGLNGFSPQACDSRTPAIARSFLPSDYAAAAALDAPRNPHYPGLWSQMLTPRERSRPLDLRDLLDLCREPCRIFVRRLGLQLPQPLDALSQRDTLALEPLARWSLRNRLLKLRLTGGDEASLLARAVAAGELPRGRYGDELWSRMREQTPSIPDPGLTEVTKRIELQLGQYRIVTALPAEWYRSAEDKLLYCTASSRTPEKVLSMQIAMLCLVLDEGITQVETWFAKEKKPKVILAPSRTCAKELLSALCDLHTLAECLPLPFWPESYARMHSLEEKARRNAHLELLPEQLLLSAWSTWSLGNAFLGTPPDRALPATQACFRGLDDPFTWQPPLALEWLPEPTTPLAWRLFRFFSNWQALAGAKP